MGIMKLMMFRGKPIPIKSPMVIKTVVTAKIMGARMSKKDLKKIHIKRKMARPASGTETAKQYVYVYVLSAN